MILEVGKPEQIKLMPVIKKTCIFESGPNGVVIENQKGKVMLYATNSACSRIFAVVALGDSKTVRQNRFQIAARSRDMILIHGKDIRIVLDYGQKKVAVNQTQIPVTGKADWGADARMPWQRRMNSLFGITVDPMDWDEGREFWKWFLYNEVEILEKSAAGGADAEQIARKVCRRLAPVLRFENPQELQLSLRNGADGRAMVIRWAGDTQLQQDAQILGTLMPEALGGWSVLVEE